MTAQTLNYIVLEKSVPGGGTAVGGTAKRYRVVHGSLKRPLLSTRTIRRTLTGAPDVQEGYVVQTFSMTLRTHYQEADSNYGTLDDLRSFYQLSNPNATPSNILRYYSNIDSNGDGVGDLYLCHFTGGYDEESVIPILTSAEAMYFVPITLEVR